MGHPVPSAGIHLGRVTSFDPARGLGRVTVEAGGADAGNVADEAYDFHATAIADGSRTIDVGTQVTFVVTPGRRGRYEAGSLVPASGGSPNA